DRTKWLSYRWRPLRRPCGRSTPSDVAAGSGARPHACDPMPVTPSLRSPLRRWSAVLVAVLLLAACSATQDVDLSHTAIAHFRELMAAQKFEQIYSESADEFKKTTTEQNLTRLLAAIDRKL